MMNTMSIGIKRSGFRKEVVLARDKDIARESAAGKRSSERSGKRSGYPSARASATATSVRTPNPLAPFGV